MWYIFVTLFIIAAYYKFIYFLGMYLYHKLYTKDTSGITKYYTELYEWVQAYISLVKWG